MESKISNALVHTAKSFVRFCVVGVMNTGVDLLIYFILTRMLGIGGFPIIAKTCSYIIATFNSLYFNHRWSFERTDAITAHVAMRYFGTVGLGIFINVSIHWFDLHVLDMPDLLSVLVAASGTAVWGYAWSRLFVFRI